MRVRRERVLAAGERTDEHEQRRLGQMKVRQQRIRHLKFETRPDEQASFTVKRRERSDLRFAPTRFSAADSSARTTVVPTAITRWPFNAGAPYGLAGRGAHLDALRMQHMRIQDVAAYGLKCSRTDVQGNEGMLDAALFKASINAGSKCRLAVGAATAPASRAKMLW